MAAVKQDNAESHGRRNSTTLRINTNRLAGNKTSSNKSHDGNNNLMRVACPQQANPDGGVAEPFAVPGASQLCWGASPFDGLDAWGLRVQDSSCPI